MLFKLDSLKIVDLNFLYDIKTNKFEVSVKEFNNNKGTSNFKKLNDYN